MTNQIYSEDIKAAIKLAGITNTEFATNMFRLTEHQANDVRNGNTVGYTSVNAKCKKGNRRCRALLTPRMVEAAASLYYTGKTQLEIAEIFECDHRTVSHRLRQYHGYKR